MGSALDALTHVMFSKRFDEFEAREAASMIVEKLKEQGYQIVPVKPNADILKPIAMASYANNEYGVDDSADTWKETIKLCQSQNETIGGIPSQTALEGSVGVPPIPKPQG